MPPIHAVFVRAPKDKVGNGFELRFGGVVISHRLVKEINQRRQLHSHWCRIQCGKRSIYRVIQFAPTLKGGAANESAEAEIVLDWLGWIYLSDYAESVPEKQALEISPLPWWKQGLAAWHHPDPSMRLSSRIALLLGALSLALAILSFI